MLGSGVPYTRRLDRGNMLTLDQQVEVLARLAHILDRLQESSVRHGGAVVLLLAHYLCAFSLFLPGTTQGLRAPVFFRRADKRSASVQQLDASSPPPKEIFTQHIRQGPGHAQARNALAGAPHRTDPTPTAALRFDGTPGASI